MPMVYGVNLGSNTLTTSATPNTEVDDMFVKAGVRNCAIQAMYLHGKGAGLTAISGITMRLKRWTTASTAGTAITPTPRDPGAQASKCTAAFTPTAGSGGGTYGVQIGCGAAGPGGWVAPNADSVYLLEGGSAHSLDAISASGTASLVHDVALEVVE